MLQRTTYFAVLATVSLAFVTYTLKLETSRIQARVTAIEAQIKRTKADIVALQAEWSLLSRPARIEHLAKTKLGLGPAGPEQYLAIDDLKRFVALRSAIKPLPANVGSERGAPGPSGPRE